VKWFFYPGFTPRTGGLLREAGLASAQSQFDRGAWLARHTQPRPGERVCSLFAYAHAPFDALFERLDTEPTLLMLCAGASQAAALKTLSARPSRHLRVHAMPWLTQPEYDRLLWSCDLNFARGEDSIVRAMWAGAPFVWHIYPQHDGVHAGKLGALLGRMNAGAAVRQLWHAWNGLGPWPAALPPLDAWRAECAGWRETLLGQQDLVTQLQGFVATKRAAAG
jgi:uncharacterized repeat protein (TIGR03837 family)